MKLFFAPGACSIGIHVLMEEIGKPYEAIKVNFAQGEQYKEPYISMNPKSKVPALARDDGSVLTEYGAIATWLGLTNPEKKLIPSNPEAQARMVEAMDYIVGTMHMQGFTRIFRPMNFAPSEADHDAVKKRGRDIFEGGLRNIDKTLAGKEYLAGDYSIADSALFYVSRWATVALKMELPANVAAHFARMNARPAVQRTLKAEGF